MSYRMRCLFVCVCIVVMSFGEGDMAAATADEASLPLRQGQQQGPVSRWIDANAFASAGGGEAAMNADNGASILGDLGEDATAEDTMAILGLRSPVTKLKPGMLVSLSTAAGRFCLLGGLFFVCKSATPVHFHVANGPVGSRGYLVMYNGRHRPRGPIPPEALMTDEPGGRGTIVLKSKLTGKYCQVGGTKGCHSHRGHATRLRVQQVMGQRFTVRKYGAGKKPRIEQTQGASGTKAAALPGEKLKPTRAPLKPVRWYRPKVKCGLSSKQVHSVAAQLKCQKGAVVRNAVNTRAQKQAAGTMVLGLFRALEGLAPMLGLSQETMPQNGCCDALDREAKLRRKRLNLYRANVERWSPGVAAVCCSLSFEPKKSCMCHPGSKTNCRKLVRAPGNEVEAGRSSFKCNPRLPHGKGDYELDRNQLSLSDALLGEEGTQIPRRRDLTLGLSKAELEQTRNYASRFLDATQLLDVTEIDSSKAQSKAVEEVAVEASAGGRRRRRARRRRARRRRARRRRRRARRRRRRRRFGKAFKKIGKSFKKVARKVSKGVKKAAKAVIKVAKKVGKTIVKIAKMVAKGLDPMAIFKKLLEAILKKLPKLVQQIVRKVLPKLFKGQLVPAIQAVEGILIKSGPWKRFAQAVTPLVLKSKWHEAKDLFRPLFKNLVINPMIRKQGMNMLTLDCGLSDWMLPLASMNYDVTVMPINFRWPEAVMKGKFQPQKGPHCKASRVKEGDGAMKLRFVRRHVASRNANRKPTKWDNVCQFDVSYDVFNCRNGQFACNKNWAWAVDRNTTATFRGADKSINKPGHGCRRWFISTHGVVNAIINAFIQIKMSYYMRKCRDMNDSSAKPTCSSKLGARWVTGAPLLRPPKTLRKTNRWTEGSKCGLTTEQHKGVAAKLQCPYGIQRTVLESGMYKRGIGNMIQSIFSTLGEASHWLGVSSASLPSRSCCNALHQHARGKTPNAVKRTKYSYAAIKLCCARNVSPLPRCQCDIKSGRHCLPLYADANTRQNQVDFFGPAGFSGFKDATLKLKCNSRYPPLTKLQRQVVGNFPKEEETLGEAAAELPTESEERRDWNDMAAFGWRSLFLPEFRKLGANPKPDYEAGKGELGEFGEVAAATGFFKAAKGLMQKMFSRVLKEILKKIPKVVRGIISKVVPRLFKGDLVGAVQAVIHVFIKSPNWRKFLADNAKNAMNGKISAIWANFQPRVKVLLAEPVLSKKGMPLIALDCHLRAWALPMVDSGYNIKITPISFTGILGQYNCGKVGQCGVKLTTGPGCKGNDRGKSWGPLKMMFKRQQVLSRNKLGVPKKLKDVCQFDLTLDMFECEGRAKRCKLSESWNSARLNSANFQGNNKKLNVPGHGCRRWFMGVQAISNAILGSYMQLADGLRMGACPSMADGLVKPSCSKRV